MATKNGTKFLTEILNIEGIKVISHSQQPGIGIMLQVDSIFKESHCHRCGTKSHRLHQNHRYVVKDLSWGEKPVFLEINRRQFKCKKCGQPFNEKLDFVMNRRTYTKRLATQTIQKVLKSDIHSVAKKGVVTTEEIEKMLEDASLQLSSRPSLLKKKCGQPFSEKLNFVMNRRTYTKRLATQTIQEVLKSDIHSVAKKGVVTTEEIEKMLEDASLQLSSKPSLLKKIGIDEIALIKCQGNYCAVLIDLETSKLITIIPGRTQVDIKKVLISWGTEVLEQIEEVSIDLWRGYKTLVMALIPNVQVVADRFHVALQVNKELDTHKKREIIPATDLEKNTKYRSNKAECKQLLEGLNKSKYPLFKNEQDLNEKQKIKLMQVKNVCPTLKIRHELKEDFRQIFEKTTNWLKALFKLGQWHKKAQKYFPNSGNTIIQWLDEIIAYFNNRTTSGVVEGINNKLKLIKRSAYGFRNFDNYKNRCFFTWHFNC